MICDRCDDGAPRRAGRHAGEETQIFSAVGSGLGDGVTIVGRGDLADRYEIALSRAGLDEQKAPENIAARGHFLIAPAAGAAP